MKIKLVGTCRTFSIVFIIFIGIYGCGEKLEQEKSKNEALKSESTVDAASAGRLTSHNQISTFLTFQENNAEEAMEFYISLFDNSRVIDVQRYGKDGPAPEGSIMLAKFSLNGKEMRCSDSYIKHEWTFTPGVSMFVECNTMVELEELFEKLSAGGQVMMPLDNYGFSQKFGFVEDRFGVSWQLNLQ
ncbi:MAG: VOC family protein [Bacteroidota bacterium]